ncbi:MAG TPA: OsmC family protein [Rhizomicrobium sp.]|nr:OsmC family protein [Rhizomicrobium sp.]
MPVRTADAEWRGGLQDGSGLMRLGSQTFEGPYSFKSRFADGKGTNPEELIGAAHAGCYSMALAAGLGRENITVKRIHTSAKVHLDRVGEGVAITKIELETEAEIPGFDDAKFQSLAERTKQECPVSKALAGTTITLVARLVG